MIPQEILDFIKHNPDRTLVSITIHLANDQAAAIGTQIAKLKTEQTALDAAVQANQPQPKP